MDKEAFEELLGLLYTLFISGLCLQKCTFPFPFEVPDMNEKIYTCSTHFEMEKCSYLKQSYTTNNKRYRR